MKIRWSLCCLIFKNVYSPSLGGNSPPLTPVEQQMETWGLFSVTPIGLALVTTGIIYFILAGRFVLPKTKSESSTKGTSTIDYFNKLYGINSGIFEVVIKDENPLIGQLLLDMETKYKVRTIGIKKVVVRAWLARGQRHMIL